MTAGRNYVPPPGTIVIDEVVTTGTDKQKKRDDATVAGTIALTFGSDPDPTISKVIAVTALAYFAYAEYQQYQENARIQQLMNEQSADQNAKGADAPKDRIKNPTKAGSKVWNGLKPFKGPIKTNGKQGNGRRYYDWDNTHNDIEVYDAQGKHLGTVDPTTGDFYKPPVPGRVLNW